MTKEDKELLLKDLSARLPYGVIVNIEYSKEHGSSDRLRVCSEGDLKLNTDLLGLFIQEEIYLKPYLRPISSMTEEEKKELQEIAVALSYNKDDIMIGTQINSFRQLDGVLDLFNLHHLDWRGLIEKGLVLEAPEGMYNFKKQ